jgi:uncharacterized protein (TIGR04255 family)
MDQEIYPNPPIVLVACEIRVPDGSLRLSDDAVDPVRAALRERLPVLSVGQRQTVAVGPGGPTTIGTERLLEFSNRDQDMVVQLVPDAIVVKTSAYGGWDDFRAVLRDVLVAVNGAGALDSYLRVGLRYIDELRHPDSASGAVDWENIVGDHLLAAAQLANGQPNLTPETWQTTTRFQAGDRHWVVVRHGPGVGTAVSPDEVPLRLAAQREGPFFLFDVDSFWECGVPIPEFNPDSLIERLDALHSPVRSLFEASITERFREEVLRVRSSHNG